MPSIREGYKSIDEWRRNSTNLQGIIIPKKSKYRFGALKYITDFCRPTSIMQGKLTVPKSFNASIINREYDGDS